MADSTLNARPASAIYQGATMPALALFRLLHLFALALWVGAGAWTG
ncbi:MAG: hypothetical protein ACRELA_15060 [Candidatus Rokuibacteriota bacterium]